MGMTSSMVLTVNRTTLMIGLLNLLIFIKNVVNVEWWAWVSGASTMFCIGFAFDDKPERRREVDDRDLPNWKTRVPSPKGE